MDFIIEKSKFDSYRDLGKKWLEKALDVALVNYSEVGVSANIDEWINNKSSLISMFSKSQYWNEETLSIIKPVSYVPRANIDESTNFFSRLISNASDFIGQNGDKDAKTAIRLLRMAQAGEISYPILSIHKERIETPEEFAFFKEVLEYPGINVGMKWSRLIQAVLKKIDSNVIQDPSFVERYTRWTESISERPATYMMTMSLNPADYILMSYGNSWSSCHIINPRIAKGSGDYNGIHKAGTLDYMSDSSTVMVQTLDKRTSPEDAPLAPRIHRNVFYVKPEIPAMVQSRFYPNNNETQVKELFMAEVKSVLAEIYGGVGNWIVPHRSRVYKVGDKHYPDYQSYGSSAVCFTDDRYAPFLALEIRFDAGNTVHCLECGREYSGNPGMLTCNRCDSGRPDDEYVECSCCGDDVLEDEARHVDDECYCERCFDENFVYCSNCDAVVHRDSSYCGADDMDYCEHCFDEMFYECQSCNATIWNEDAVSVCDEYYCEHCADEISFICHRCGDRVHNDNGHELNDREYCDDCFGEVSFCCDECGEYFHNDESHSIGDKEYCESCYEDLPECKNCGEKLLEEDIFRVKGDIYCESCSEDLEDEDDSETTEAMCVGATA